MTVHSVDQSIGLSIRSLRPTVCLLTHHLSVCPFRISPFHAPLCLSVCQSVYLSVRPYLPIFTSIQSICPSISSIGRSISPSILLHVHLSIRSSGCQSLSLSIRPSVHSSICLSLQSTCLSVHSSSPSVQSINSIRPTICLSSPSVEPVCPLVPPVHPSVLPFINSSILLFSSVRPYL